MKNIRITISFLFLTILAFNLGGCVTTSPQVTSFNEFVVKSEGLYEKDELSPIEHYSAYYEKVKPLQLPIPSQKPVLLKFGLTMLEHAEDLMDQKITRKEFNKLERRALLVLETENASVFLEEKKVNKQTVVVPIHGPTPVVPAPVPIYIPSRLYFPKPIPSGGMFRY